MCHGRNERVWQRNVGPKIGQQLHLVELNLHYMAVGSDLRQSKPRAVNQHAYS